MHTYQHPKSSNWRNVEEREIIISLASGYACFYHKKDINHLERIQRASTRWVKGLRGLNFEERLNALKLQLLEKIRIRNDLALTRRILYNQIDLEENQLFKFSRRPGLRRSSIRLLHQTGRTHRRRNSFACRVVNCWNRLTLTVVSVPEQWAFKKLLYTCIYSECLLFVLFSPQYGLFGQHVPSRSLNTYIKKKQLPVLLSLGLLLRVGVAARKKIFKKDNAGCGL